MFNHYTKITYKNLITDAFFMWLFSSSYHRVLLPNMPFGDYSDGHTVDSWAEFTKKHWNEFFEYYALKIKPQIKPFLDETKRLQEEKNHIRMPRAFAFGTYLFCVATKRQWIYVPISLIQKCEASIVAAVNQIEEINNNSERVLMLDKIKTRCELTFCASDLTRYIYDKKARELISKIEHFYHAEYWEHFSVPELVERAIGS